MLRRCTLYHLSQLFHRMRLTVMMLLSGKIAVKKGAGQDEISLVFLLVSLVDPCLLCRRADGRATALVKKFISVQRFSAMAADTLIGRFWGGLFFFPFASLLFLGEVWNSPGTATAGCSPVSGFACTQIPNLWLSKYAYCFSFSNIWALSWWCKLWEYCVVCGAVASTRKRTVSAELKHCFLLDGACFLFCFLK